MTDVGLRLIAAALAIGLGAIGPGLGVGILVGRAMDAGKWAVVRLPRSVLVRSSPYISLGIGGR